MFTCHKGPTKYHGQKTICRAHSNRYPLHFGPTQHRPPHDRPIAGCRVALWGAQCALCTPAGVLGVHPPCRWDLLLGFGASPRLMRFLGFGDGGGLGTPSRAMGAVGRGGTSAKTLTLECTRRITSPFKSCSSQ